MAKLVMGIGEAIKELRGGNRVARLGWNGQGQFLEIKDPSYRSEMTLSYVYITTVNGQRVPWLCSQTDLLAEDWVVIDYSDEELYD